MATQQAARNQVSQKSLTIRAAASYTRPLTIVTTLFFMRGFLTCLNDILVPT
jgi:fucose permease